MNKFILIIFSLAFITCGNAKPKNDYLVIKPDSLVQNLLGDTICKILSKPTKIYLYTLNPQKDTLSFQNEKFFRGYVIDKYCGKIEPESFSVIKYLIFSKSSYDLSETNYKCKFLPYIGLVVYCQNEKIEFNFAFNCKSIEIKYKGKSKIFKYTFEKTIIDYFDMLLSDDTYIKTIKKQLYENN